MSRMTSQAVSKKNGCSAVLSELSGMRVGSLADTHCPFAGLRPFAVIAAIDGDRNKAELSEFRRAGESGPLWSLRCRAAR